MDSLAPHLLRHRWFKSRATHWDHAMTRRSLLEALAAPILTLHKYLWGAACRLPSWLAFFPILFRENFCITLASGV